MENGERKKCLAGPRSIVLCGVSGASPSAGESTRAGVPGELSDIAARRASGDGQRTKDKGQSTKCFAGPRSIVFSPPGPPVNETF